jgi:hypothetical protein
LMCTSGICIDGLCQAQALEDLTPCEENGDCLSGACGKHPIITDDDTTLSAAATTILQDLLVDKVCCPSGQVFGYKGESFCTASQSRMGSSCVGNPMCTSEVCIFQECFDEPLSDGSECEEHADCANGVCALYQGTNICCPTGEMVFHSGVVGWVCSNRPDGDVCENINANSLCHSGICIEGICQEAQQDLGLVCDNHADCQNHACALEVVPDSSDTTLPQTVCCPTGEYAFVIDPFDSSNGDSGSAVAVCTGQPVGASCSDLDELCTSGVCLSGICQARPQAEGSVCENDLDCATRVCAWSSLEVVHSRSVGKVCCPSGDHTYVFFVGKQELNDVCTGQPVGANCADNMNALCASGVCVHGTCQETTQPAGSMCDDDWDCSSDVCVNEVCMESKQELNDICDSDRDCTSGICIGGRCRESIQPAGGVCDVDSDCISGVCIMNACASETQAPGAICDSNTDCANRACAWSAATPVHTQLDDLGNNSPLQIQEDLAGEMMICCPSGESHFIPAPYGRRVCTGQVEFCANNVDGLCSSGVCVFGVCMDGKRPVGEECDSPTDCLDGTYCIAGVCQAEKQSVGLPCKNDNECQSSVCVSNLCAADRQPSASPCDNDSDCVNGVCSWSSLKVGASTICCPTNADRYVPWEYRTALLENDDTGAAAKNKRVCTGQPSGAPCGITSGICASGVCASGICQ